MRIPPTSIAKCFHLPPAIRNIDIAVAKTTINVPVSGWSKSKMPASPTTAKRGRNPKRKVPTFAFTDENHAERYSTTPNLRNSAG